MFGIGSACVPRGIRRPCGHGPAQGEAQVVPELVIFAYSGPAHAEVEGRACPHAVLAALHEFHICSTYVPHMFRICSAYVLHGIRRPCGHGPAQGETQVVPVRVISTYSGPAHAEVEGRACPPAMPAAPHEFRICSAYVPHMFRTCSAWYPQAMWPWPSPGGGPGRLSAHYFFIFWPSAP